MLEFVRGAKVVQARTGLAREAHGFIFHLTVKSLLVYG
jgi:hypothetical protein